MAEKSRKASHFCASFFFLNTQKCHWKAAGTTDVIVEITGKLTMPRRFSTNSISLMRPNQLLVWMREAAPEQ